MTEAPATGWAALFAERPAAWGLRADPVVWSRMAARLAAAPWPDAAAERARAINEAFRAVTAPARATPDPAVLHDPSMKPESPGLSAGAISLTFWLETGLPHLIARAA